MPQKSTLGHAIREGKHGACSANQAIAIGISKETQRDVQFEPLLGEPPSNLAEVEPLKPA